MDFGPGEEIIWGTSGILVPTKERAALLPGSMSLGAGVCEEGILANCENIHTSVDYNNNGSDVVAMASAFLTKRRGSAEKKTTVQNVSGICIPKDFVELQGTSFLAFSQEGLEDVSMHQQGGDQQKRPSRRAQKSVEHWKRVAQHHKDHAAGAAIVERQGWDIRIAWRDAALFHVIRREQRWICALSISCWRTWTCRMRSLNLGLSRFVQRTRQSHARSNLLAWWAKVLLRDKSLRISPVSQTSYCNNEETISCEDDFCTPSESPRSQGSGSKSQACPASSHMASDNLLPIERVVERALTFSRLSADCLATGHFFQGHFIVQELEACKRLGLSCDDKSAIITSVLVGGPAFNTKRVYEGDQIIGVDGNSVSPEHVRSSLQDGDMHGSVVELLLKRTSGEIESVKLQRMSSIRSKMFEFFAKVEDLTKKEILRQTTTNDEEVNVHEYMEQMLDLWNDMMREQQKAREFLEEQESLLLGLLSNSSPTMPFPKPSESQNRSHTEWQILHTPDSLFLKDSPDDRFLGNASALQKQAEDLRSIKAKVAALQQEMSIATQRAQLAEAELAVLRRQEAAAVAAVREMEDMKSASLRAVDLAVDGNVAAKLQQRIHAFEEEARDYEERLHSLSKSTLELESMLRSEEQRRKDSEKEVLQIKERQREREREMIEEWDDKLRNERQRCEVLEAEVVKGKREGERERESRREKEREMEAEIARAREAQRERERQREEREWEQMREKEERERERESAQERERDKERKRDKARQAEAEELRGSLANAQKEVETLREERDTEREKRDKERTDATSTAFKKEQEQAREMLRLTRVCESLETESEKLEQHMKTLGDRWKGETEAAAQQQQQLRLLLLSEQATFFKKEQDQAREMILLNRVCEALETESEKLEHDMQTLGDSWKGVSAQAALTAQQEREQRVEMQRMSLATLENQIENIEPDVSRDNDVLRSIADLVVLISSNDHSAESKFLEDFLLCDETRPSDVADAAVCCDNDENGARALEGGGRRGQVQRSANLNFQEPISSTHRPPTVCHGGRHDRQEQCGPTQVRSSAADPSFASLAPRARHSAGCPVVIVGTAVRELVAMMLLRYRVLRVEQQQVVASLEQQLQHAFQQVDAVQQELSSCYVQLQEISLRSAKALAGETLLRKKVEEDMIKVSAEKEQLGKERQQLRALCVCNAEKEIDREREETVRAVWEKEREREQNMQEMARHAREREAEDERKKLQEERDELQRQGEELKRSVDRLHQRCRHLELQLLHSNGEAGRMQGGSSLGTLLEVRGVDFQAHTCFNTSENERDMSRLYQDDMRSRRRGNGYCGGGERGEVEGVGLPSCGGVSLGVPALSNTHIIRAHSSSATSLIGNGKVALAGDRGVEMPLCSALNALATDALATELTAKSRSFARVENGAAKAAWHDQGAGKEGESNASSRGMSPQELNTIGLSISCLRQASPTGQRDKSRRCSTSLPSQHDDIGRALDEACKELECLEAQLMAI